MHSAGGASLPSSCPDARKRRVSYFYEPTIGDYDYGEHHPMKPKRIRMAHNLIVKYNLHRRMEISRPFPAAVDDIRGFHSPEYVDFLSSVSPNILPTKKHARSLKRFNFGDDCPVFDGLFSFCQASAGGSIGAAVKLNRQDADIAINWGGGLHHAMKSEASGFCYVNDIVLGILELLKVYRRVLYVDIDIHHGDGVEEAFYETDRVMTVSFHKFGGGFFPKTGKLKDVGKASGKYYALNVPLKDGVNDENFRSLFCPIMQKVMGVYQPEAVVLQCGADSLSGDQIGSFNLSVKGHADCLRFLRSFNVPLMVLGGGGYTIENVARCWCYETAVAVDVEPDNKLPYNEYYKSFGPDYTLHVQPSNMKNLNKRKDLEKIRNTLLDQLSKLQHSPSTQFQTMPPTTQVPDEREEDMEVRPEPRIWNGEHDYESDGDEIEKPMRSLHNEATYRENTDLRMHSAGDIVSQLAGTTVQKETTIEEIKSTVSGASTPLSSLHTDIKAAHFNIVDHAAQTDPRFNNLQHKVDNVMVGKAEELIEVEKRAMAAQMEAGRKALEAQAQAAEEALNPLVAEAVEKLKESVSQEILKTLVHRESEILKKVGSCLDTLQCGAEALQHVAEHIRNAQPYVEECLDRNQINLTSLSIRLKGLKKRVDMMLCQKKRGKEKEKVSLKL